MSNKIKIVAATLLLLGFASSAMAQEAQKASDQYPFLPHIAQQQAGEYALASANVQHAVKPFTATERAVFNRATRGVSIR